MEFLCSIADEYFDNNEYPSLVEKLYKMLEMVFEPINQPVVEVVLE